jgi:hypothetical protein
MQFLRGINFVGMFRYAKSVMIALTRKGMDLAGAHELVRRWLINPFKPQKRYVFSSIYNHFILSTSTVI